MHIPHYVMLEVMDYRSIHTLCQVDNARKQIIMTYICKWFSNIAINWVHFWRNHIYCCLTVTWTWLIELTIYAVLLYFMEWISTWPNVKTKLIRLHSSHQSHHSFVVINLVHYWNRRTGIYIYYTEHVHSHSLLPVIPSVYIPWTFVLFYHLNERIRKPVTIMLCPMIHGREHTVHTD